MSKFRYFEKLKDLLRNKTEEMLSSEGGFSEISSWYDEQEEILERESNLSCIDLNKISRFARFQVERETGFDEFGVDIGPDWKHGGVMLLKEFFISLPYRFD